MRRRENHAPGSIAEELIAEFEDKDVPAQSNPAVALFCRATLMIYRQAREKGDCDRDARRKSSRAFRPAMPPLIGKNNIRDFIACVTHGILIEVIPPKDVGKLLYAAQVAQGTCRPEARTNQAENKKRKKSVSGEKTAASRPAKAA